MAFLRCFRVRFFDYDMRYSIVYVFRIKQKNITQHLPELILFVISNMASVTSKKVSITWNINLPKKVHMHVYVMIPYLRR